MNIVDIEKIDFVANGDGSSASNEILIKLGPQHENRVYELQVTSQVLIFIKFLEYLKTNYIRI